MRLRCRLFWVGSVILLPACSEALRPPAPPELDEAANAIVDEL